MNCKGRQVEDGKSRCTVTSVTRGQKDMEIELSSKPEVRRKKDNFSFKIPMNPKKLWDSE